MFEQLTDLVKSPRVLVLFPTALEAGIRFREFLKACGRENIQQASVARRWITFTNGSRVEFEGDVTFTWDRAKGRNFDYIVSKDLLEGKSLDAARSLLSITQGKLLWLGEDL